MMQKQLSPAVAAVVIVIVVAILLAVWFLVFSKPKKAQPAAPVGPGADVVDPAMMQQPVPPQAGPGGPTPSAAPAGG
jgi:hypothetical protein